MLERLHVINSVKGNTVEEIKAAGAAAKAELDNIHKAEMAELDEICQKMNAATAAKDFTEVIRLMSVLQAKELERQAELAVINGEIKAGI